MSARLGREQVSRHAADLRTTLTPVQSARLDAVLALLDGSSTPVFVTVR